MIFEKNKSSNKEMFVENSKKYIDYFNYESIKNLKKVGSGTDATIYKINSDLFLKLYNLRSDLINNNTSPSKEHIRTGKPSKFINNFKFQSQCYDEDGVRLGYEKIIEFAQNRQNIIKNTYLPLNPCYLEGSFKGCIIKGFNGYFPIDHFRYLPKKYKLIILSRLLAKFKELVECNIYPIDLYNKQASNLPHNNIIINYLLNPQIIDLDGKSVAYTSKFNEEYYYQSTFGLTTLLLEFLFDQDLEDYFNEFDEFNKYYFKYFLDKGVDMNILSKIISTNVNISNIEDFISRQRK